MERRFTLKLTIDNEPEIELSGKISEVDWEILDEFCEYADVILRTRLIQERVPVSINLHMGVKTRVESSANLPDWENVRAFLHAYRPVGLQKERTYFFKVCNILDRTLDHSSIHSLIDQQRDRYIIKSLRSLFEIQYGDAFIISEKFLEDWLNAYEYHQDKDKRDFFNELNIMFPNEVQKGFFVLLMFERINAIHIITLLARTVLGKQEGFRISRNED